MATEEATYRELVLEKLDRLDEKTDRIESQTVKTNGRVTTLETKSAVQAGQMKVIRTILYAIAGSITFVMGSIVVPIVVAYIQAH